MEELIKELLQLKETCEKSVKDFSKTLRHNKDLSSKVELATLFLPSSVRNSERVFCILNKITKPILCKTCLINPAPFNYKTKDGYRLFCSSKCSSNDSEVILKRLSNRDESAINNKREETIAKANNGVRNYSQTPEGKKVIRIKKLQDYADLDKKEIILEKFKQTSLIRFGVENPAQADECKEKAKETNFNNSGFESYLQTPECRELSAKSLRTPEAKLHKIETNKERYGKDIDNTFKLLKSVENRKRAIFNKKIKSLKILGIIALFSYENFKGVNRDYEYPFKCEKCNDIFKDHLDWGHIPRCFKCNPRMVSTSKYELEILNFIRQVGYNKTIIRNDRQALKPERKHSKELDLYFPEDNFAIEFNGLWSHSEYQGDKNNNYHLDKTNLCEEKGIKLIHVFEDDWVNKTEVIKSIIKYNLKLIDVKIPANKCVVTAIDSDQIISFLKDNHLDYPYVGTYHFGMYFNDELVFVISLGTPHRNKKYQFQLYRSCSKINTVVVGGFSKIINYAVKTLNVKSLLSYVDRRLFTGSGYENDWVKIKTIRPDYEYVDLKESKRYHKSNFKRESIEKKFPEFYDKHKSKTEKEMMFMITFSDKSTQKRFDRIWTCGLFVFEYKI